MFMKNIFELIMKNIYVCEKCIFCSVYPLCLHFGRLFMMGLAARTLRTQNRAVCSANTERVVL